MSNSKPSTSRGVRQLQGSHRRDRHPADIHDWVDYYRPHDTWIYPLLAADVAQFYDRLREINRGDFTEHLSTRLSQLKIQQSIAETLYIRYEAAYLTLQQESHVAQSSASAGDFSIDKSTFRRKSESVALQARRIEQERQVLDFVRSWRSYVDEWVAVMDELFCHWEAIWDWYECGSYGGAHFHRQHWGNLPDVNRHVELLKGLRELEVRAEFAMKGASEKGNKVFSLGACG